MKTIYVSLDELLDTRLGFVSLYNEELVQKWLQEDNHEFFLRHHESVLWSALGWDEATWNERWDNRDVETLRNSIITHIPSIIMGIIHDYVLSGEESLANTNVTLVVNTAPYYLTDDEIEEYRKLLEEYFATVNEVKMIRRDLDRLDYLFVRSQFDYVFMYEYNKWLKLHEHDLSDKVMTNVTFFIPRLFYKLPNFTEEELANEDFKHLLDLDVFKVMEYVTAVKIPVKHLPVSDFSIALRKPYRRAEGVTDLEDLPDPSVHGTLQTFPTDPQPQSHPRSEV
nr:MAG TPA: hypothetical protein [Caudoviricetes sp.]